MSATGGEGEGRDEQAPVPVRDLMKQPQEPAEADAAGARDDGPQGGESRRFEVGEDVWLARAVGVGAYGTGGMGRARLVAVQFFRESEPETPVREALVAAGRFPHLRPEELRALFDGATPMAVPGEERP